MRGELKIAGYSAYLHPVGAHQLLGVGQDATPRAPATGTQLSLFDVADPAAPKLLQQGQARPLHLVPGRVRPPRVPVVGAAAAGGDPGLRRGRHDGGSAFKVDHGRITPAGSSHENGFVLRTLIVAGRLLTLSDHALSVYDPATLRPGPVARF